MSIKSIDVECVAHGQGHNDRTPAWVAVVDSAGNTLLDEKIKVENVFDYLTPLTGIHPGDLDGAKSLEEVQRLVKSVIQPSDVLVGQKPGGGYQMDGFERRCRLQDKCGHL